MNNNSRNNNRKNCSEQSETTRTATNECTEIDIDDSTLTEASQPLQSRNSDTETPQNTNINMEFDRTNIETSNETDGRVGRNSATSAVQRNLLTLFSDARQQFARPHIHAYSLLEQGSAAVPNGPAPVEQLNSTDVSGGLTPRRNSYNSSDSQHIHHHHHASTSLFFPTPSPTHSRNIRSWRMNLNNVLSFSSAPSTEAIRSLITNSGTFRYTPLSTNADVGDNINTMVSQEPPAQNARPRLIETTSNRDGIFSRTETNSDMSSENINRSSTTTASSGDTSINVQQENISSTLFTNRTAQQQQPGAIAGAAANNRNTFQDDEDNNVISDMFVKFLSHFVRYLPFICILFVKFIHDHLLGILDLLLLHGIMYQVNKSLRDQVAKFSQKSYGILLRDFSLVSCVVVYRFLLASSTPDPFGLLITPPNLGVTLGLSKGVEVTSDTKDKLAAEISNYLAARDQQPSAAAVVTTSLENTVTITKAISLGVLLYYVAVNDLILKLLTILIKISITLMPTKVIRHKPRARMYVLVEYFSQFYRALAPVRQWLIFLFESYSGLEVISGILFSSFYMGAKGFEFVDRGKSLKKALINFVRNMDYERKPTKDELDASGSLCPICHDAYTTPIVLECGHIFCDDCVSTWFKREQTCPMCRANVSDDPAWQDGSTTFFYQLC